MGNVLLTFPILIVYIAGAFFKVLHEASAFLVSNLTFPSLHLKSPTFLIRLTFLPSFFFFSCFLGRLEIELVWGALRFEASCSQLEEKYLSIPILLSLSPARGDHKYAQAHRTF